MRAVWLTAVKDLRRLGRDRLALGLWTGIPVFVLLLMYLVFGRGDPKPQGRLLIADEDGTIVSAFVAGAFQQGPLGEMLRVERVKREEGHREMTRGKASALLVIPKGFARAFLRREPAQLTLITNPAQRILPGLIEEAASLLVEAGFYLQQLAGGELETLTAAADQGTQSLPDETIASVSVRFHHLGRNLAAWLDPPRIRLEVQTGDGKAPAQTNLGALFVPGMLFLSLLFVAQGLSMDLWRERQRGTLARWLTTPAPAASLLAGKLLAAMLVFAMLSLAGLACALWVAGLRWKALAPGALWCTLSGAVIFLLLAVLQIEIRSERAAHVVTNLVLFPMILVGGSLFPLEVMPAWLARIGRLTPNGWALAHLKTILDGSADATRLVAATAGLLLAGTAAFAVAARQLRRRHAP